MVSSIAPPVSVQGWRGHPIDRTAGIPGSCSGLADSIAATGSLEAIKQSATDTSISPLPIDCRPKSGIIRGFPWTRRDRTPQDGSGADRGKVSCSNPDSMVREGFKKALRPWGGIYPDMPRLEIIKLILGLGAYAEDLADCDVQPSVARIKELCVSFLSRDCGRAAPWNIDILA